MYVPIIKEFAPTLSRAIDGHFGLAISGIIPVIARVFGTNSNDISAINTAIINDKDAQEKLSQIEREHGDWIESIMDSVNKLSTVKINVEMTWK